MTTHVINFTNADGKAVKRTFYGKNNYVMGLKRELRKIAIRRATTTDSAVIKRLNNNEKLFRNLLAFEDDKTEIGMRLQRVYRG